MDNFWGLIIKGIADLLTMLVYGNFPTHQQIGMVQTVSTLVNTSLGVAFIVVFSNINMALPISVFGICAILEIVKWIYAAWRWLKGWIV